MFVLGLWLWIWLVWSNSATFSLWAGSCYICCLFLLLIPKFMANEIPDYFIPSYRGSYCSILPLIMPSPIKVVNSARHWLPAVDVRILSDSCSSKLNKCIRLSKYTFCLNILAFTQEWNKFMWNTNNHKNSPHRVQGGVKREMKRVK